MPTQNYQEFPLTFEKGLTTEVSNSILEEGQAARLLNWEPMAQGSLRARNAWSSISTNGLTADYEVRGWGTVAVDSGSGFATPALVQSDIDTVGTTGSMSLELTGTTAGNLLVCVVTQSDDSPDPVVSGYTKQLEQVDGNLLAAVFVFTKIATGGTESLSITTGDVLEMAWLGEISGLATEAPTDSQAGANTGETTYSCPSVAETGFALFVGHDGGSPGYSLNEPELTGGTTHFDGDPGTGDISVLITSIFSGATVSTTFNADGIAAQALVIWDATTAASTPADFYILIAVATDTGYSLYRIPRDQIQTGTWELVDSETVSDTSAYVSMAVGTGELVWSASSMSNPRHVVLSTLVAADTTDLSGLAGRAVCFHKDRIFVGGNATNPARLYFSGIATPHTFTTATDFIDVGGEDGEAIEDIISVEGLLLVCKTNRLYLISGSGIETFFVNELPGGTASTGRATVRTPYGTIVAGPTDVWVVQGGGIDPMSRPLGVNYSISGLVSTAYAQDIVLIADSSTGVVFRVNLVTGAWSQEEVLPGENQVGHLFSLQGRFYYGVSSSSTEVGGTRRLASTRGADALTDTVSYEASTGRMTMIGPSKKYTPQYLYLQTRIQDSTKPNNLRIQVETNLGTKDYGVTINSETQRDAISIGSQKGVEWLAVHYDAESSPTHSAIDVERSVLGVIVEEPRD